MKANDYRYFTLPNPPAPFVHVALALPGGTPSQDNLAAQLDTGAFKTVIPLEHAAALRLEKLREQPAEGLNGTVVLLATYLVELTVDQLSTITLEVLASDGESHILLGRDVLNRYRIVLDGPAQTLRMEET